MCCLLRVELQDLSEIERMIPDEMMLIILGHVGAYSLGRVACVCRHWRGLAEVRRQGVGHV